LVLKFGTTIFFETLLNVMNQAIGLFKVLKPAVMAMIGILVFVALILVVGIIALLAGLLSIIGTIALVAVGIFFIALGVT